MAPQNIHLTLRFLEDTPTTKLDALKENLTIEVAEFNPFEIALKKLGVFPNLYHPRLILIGVENNVELLALQKCVERVARQIGSIPEKHHFSAHLMLGHVTCKGYNSRLRYHICKIIEDRQNVDFGRIRVDSIHFFESELKPSSALY